MSHSLSRLTHSALLAAATAVCAQIAVPLPGGVPLTLSLVAVYLAGALLEPLPAFLSQLCYLLMGFCGIPVFAGFAAGPKVLFGVTGGFLLAYPIMALLVSLAVHRFGGKRFPLLLSMTVALLLCYLLGCLWFMAQLHRGWEAALTACVLPFVPVDLLKIVLSALVAHRLIPLLRPGVPALAQ